jgi:hypothetical protein
MYNLNPEDFPAIIKLKKEQRHLLKYIYCTYIVSRDGRPNKFTKITKWSKTNNVKSAK